jgi:uncharacterized peroxidase-related enzyme
MTRIPAINRAFRASDRVKLRVIRLASGREPSDILKLLFYRRDFFGDPFTAWVEDVLRGPSEWSIGERELIAAFVSSLNKCRFCTGSHGAVASIDLGPEVTAAVLADPSSAPIGDGLRAALRFASQLTLTPESVTAADILPMREAGLSAEAIGDVVHICGIFSTINRIADAVDFEVPDDADVAASAAVLRKRGYGL